MWHLARTDAPAQPLLATVPAPGHEYYSTLFWSRTEYYTWIVHFTLLANILLYSRTWILYSFSRGHEYYMQPWKITLHADMNTTLHRDMNTLSRGHEYYSTYGHEYYSTYGHEYYSTYGHEYTLTRPRILLYIRTWILLYIGTWILLYIRTWIHSHANMNTTLYAGEQSWYGKDTGSLSMAWSMFTSTMHTSTIRGMHKQYGIQPENYAVMLWCNGKQRRAKRAKNCMSPIENRENNFISRKDNRKSQLKWIW
jgi:hypothetical protein